MKTDVCGNYELEREEMMLAHMKKAMGLRLQGHRGMRRNHCTQPMKQE